jgi:cobaltochelatase CobN
MIGGKPLALAGLCLALAALALLACGPALAHQILFLTTSPVPPGKFRLLEESARQQGIGIRTHYVEKLPQEASAELLRGYDMVLIDTPRDHMRDFVRPKLAPALGQVATPRLWLHEVEPEWSGLPDALATRLHAYYVNGARNNFDRLFRTLAAHFEGRGWDEIAPPIVFPKAAIYHPDAPGLVFPDAQGYLAWKGLEAKARPATVAIALHQQYVAAGQTAFIDDLIRRIETAGALALPFYSAVMDPDAVTRMIGPESAPLADVLINTQIMLNPEGRRKEFEGLGIPVVQAMPYRKGDAATWESDVQGIAAMDIPFYLAQSEYAGVADIQIAAATRKEDEQVAPIPAQAAAVVAKALNLIRLQRKANADKRVAIFFWNYPPGEKNLSASYMNLPRSLAASLHALHAAGYGTQTPAEADLTRSLQRLLAPHYRPVGDQRELEALVRDGLAELLPVAHYRAWLEQQPAFVGEALSERWGEPERSSMVLHRGGQAFFAVPRLKLGNVVLLPQPPRGERWEDNGKALYHDMRARPSHFYLAAYLWARAAHEADALVHFGTHGTQEWQSGKERGLSVFDYPMLAVGDVPVVYPYIVDDVGEAMQAKRRGRAVIISHQTPPFAPAGLHERLVHIHDLLHAWLAQDDGVVRDKIKADFLAHVAKEHIDRDLGWSGTRIRQDFRAFLDQVHDHLHELARTAQPMGLHTFGRGADEKWRLANVLMMLGKPFWEAMAEPAEQADEMLVHDYERLTQSTPYRRLQHYLLESGSTEALPANLRESMQTARGWYAALGAQSEMTAFLAALAGRHIATSYGGDPIKNPDSLPTGRNLYGFDPSRVPTKAAWEAGKEAFDKLLAGHREQTGRAPQKLAFALWSMETMRHFGMVEAQALWALGVEPVWDAGGRVTDVRLIGRGQLGRPRVDVVLSATGLYRDHFPNTMKLLARAAQLAAQAGELDNPVADNSRRIAQALETRGWSPQAALRAAQTRLFSSESGRYGSGLDDAALATDRWQGKAEGDRRLAALYLSRMQFAYGPDEAEWGKPGENANLYAEQLAGTEGAVLSRSSNLYGMLTTDDPFQYLGGIALAVRHLDGKAPQLYVSDLRGAGSGKAEPAARFLAKELATRNFHPGYLKAVMAEGYAGTVQVLDALNNFWGWTAVSREIVRDDQWQRFKQVYVDDALGLGIKRWFERENPHAQAQMIERMLEAVRQKYWQADAGTVKELARRYRELQRRFAVASDNRRFEAFLNETVPPRELSSGFALPRPPAAPRAETPPPPASPPLAAGAQPDKIIGQRLEPVPPPSPPSQAPASQPLMSAALMLLVLAGAVRQWRVERSRRAPRRSVARGARAGRGAGVSAAALPQPGRA